MLRPRVLTLPAHIQSVYIHNLMKVFSFALLKAEENDDNERASVLTQALLNTLPVFVSSSYLEVQERVCFVSDGLLHSQCICGSVRNSGAVRAPCDWGVLGRPGFDSLVESDQKTLKVGISASLLDVQHFKRVSVEIGWQVRLLAKTLNGIASAYEWLDW